jgi:integrase/recombinase XerD
MKRALPDSMTDFIAHLRLAGRTATASNYAFHLGRVSEWLADKGLSPLTITTEQLRTYQRFIAEEERGRVGRLLAKNTQVTRLSIIKSFWSWLYRRGIRQDDPALALVLPSIPKQQVRRDHLSQQEVTAFLQTAAAQSSQFAEGSARWAIAVRDLALVTLAIISGRRRTGLRDLTCAQLDLQRSEIRVEKEKGKTGRVLPIATWGCVVLKTYVTQARPILCWQKDNPYLFVGEDGPQLGTNTLAGIIERLQIATVKANPDLTDLTDKHLTPHSLRVTFASLLFNGGATIRTINELMLHQQLGVTARYIPVNVDDLHRVCATAHPRA